MLSQALFVAACVVLFLCVVSSGVRKDVLNAFKKVQDVVKEKFKK